MSVERGKPRPYVAKAITRNAAREAVMDWCFSRVIPRDRRGMTGASEIILIRAGGTPGTAPSRLRVSRAD